MDFIKITVVRHINKQKSKWNNNGISFQTRQSVDEISFHTTDLSTITTHTSVQAHHGFKLGETYTPTHWLHVYWPSPLPSPPTIL